MSKEARSSRGRRPFMSAVRGELVEPRCELVRFESSLGSLGTGPSSSSGRALRHAQEGPFDTLRTGPSTRLHVVSAGKSASTSAFVSLRRTGRCGGQACSGRTRVRGAGLHKAQVRGELVEPRIELASFKSSLGSLGTGPSTRLHVVSAGKPAFTSAFVSLRRIGRCGGQAQGVLAL